MGKYNMKTEKYIKLINDLVRMPAECEWMVFKQNFHLPEEIGERILK